jgi:retron-type reverse transcriptase
VQDPKLRFINKASVRDRVVHQALFRIVYHIYDRSFIFDSYSCRLNKGTHCGVRRLETYARKITHSYDRPVYVLKCDVRKFFDSIYQKILFRLLCKYINDDRVLRLLKIIINSFGEDGRGIPLGNVTSQLFANVYLNELDQYIKHSLKQKYYLRYCDDFIILNTSRNSLENLVLPISDFLQNELRLALHPRKVSIRKFSTGIDFLGYVVRPHNIVLRTRTKRRIMQRITHANKDSYFGILKHCNGYRIETSLSKKLTSQNTG